MKTSLPYTLLIIFIFLGSSVTAQQSTFSRVIHDNINYIEVFTVAKSADNHYMIAGSDGSYPCFVRIDSAGNPVLCKTFGPETGALNSIISTSDSGFLLAGRSGDNVWPNQDAIILKINSSGDTIWTRRFDAAGIETPLSVTETLDKGYLVTGIIYFPSWSTGTMFICKLSHTGVLQWSEITSTLDDWQQANGITQSSDGSIYLTGHTWHLPYCNAYIAKLNPSGNLVWYKTISPGVGHDIIALNDGIVWYGSTVGYLSGQREYYFVKTDTAGTIIWQKALSLDINGSGDYTDGTPMSHIHPSPDGALIAEITEPWQDVYTAFLKISAQGDIDFCDRISCSINDVVSANDSGYLILGSGPMIYKPVDTLYMPEVGIVKLSTDGTGNDCVASAIYYSDTANLSLVNSPLAFYSAGTIKAYHPTITNLNLSSNPGCVDINYYSVDEHSGFDELPEISPNPSHGIIKIESGYPQQKIRELCVYDMQGFLIRNIHGPVSLPFSLDLSSFSDGMYLVQMMLADKMVIKRIQILR
jgi:hypothetical protein